MPNRVEKYLIVEIDFKSKTFPYSVETYYFSNRFAEIGELVAGSTTQYFPLLKNIADLGTEMGEVLPRNKFGSVTLDNTRGGIRYDLRVSDLLATRSIIDQKIRVKTFQKRIGLPGLLGDFVTEFDGYCSDVSINHSDNTISIGTYDNYGGTDILNAVISRQNYPTAPERSLARPMNVIFGEGVEVLVQRVNQSSTTYHYGYGTTIGDTFLNGGINKFLCKDRASGTFGEVTSIESLSNPVVAGFGQAGYESSMYLDVQEGVEYAYKINFPTGRIITGGRFYALSTGDYNPETDPLFAPGKCIFSIYANMQGNTEPDQTRKIAYCNVPWSSFRLNYLGPVGGLGTRSLWAVDFAFNEAVVCRAGVDYFFSWRNEASTASRYLLPINNLLFTEETWVIPGSSVPGEDQFFRNVGSSNIIHWRLYGALIEDLTNDVSQLQVDSETGRGINKFRLNPAAAQAQPTSGFDNLEFIVNVNGIKDRSASPVTGVSGKQLVSALDISRFLNFLSGERAIVTNAYNFQNISTPSTMRGCFDAIISVQNALSEILFNSSSKLVPLRNGTVAYYRYGALKTSYHFINEDDCKLLSLHIDDKASIINAANVFFSKTPQPLTIEDVQEGSKNYTQSISLSSQSGFFAASNAIYGKRFLSDRGTYLDFVADESQARYFCDSIFRQFAMEQWTVDLLLPYWVDEYRNIEVNSVIRFRHQKNLNAAGSESPATRQRPLPNNSFNFGLVWVRAKSYPLRVAKRSVEYTMDGGEPYIRLSGKILDSKFEVF